MSFKLNIKINYEDKIDKSYKLATIGSLDNKNLPSYSEHLTTSIKTGWLEPKINDLTNNKDIIQSFIASINSIVDKNIEFIILNAFTNKNLLSLKNQQYSHFAIVFNFKEENKNYKYNSVVFFCQTNLVPMRQSSGTVSRPNIDFTLQRIEFLDFNDITNNENGFVFKDNIEINITEKDENNFDISNAIFNNLQNNISLFDETEDKSNLRMNVWKNFLNSFKDYLKNIEESPDRMYLIDKEKFNYFLSETKENEQYSKSTISTLILAKNDITESINLFLSNSKEVNTFEIRSIKKINEHKKFNTTLDNKIREYDHEIDPLNFESNYLQNEVDSKNIKIEEMQKKIRELQSEILSKHQKLSEENKILNFDNINLDKFILFVNEFKIKLNNKEKEIKYNEIFEDLKENIINNKLEMNQLEYLLQPKNNIFNKYLDHHYESKDFKGIYNLNKNFNIDFLSLKQQQDNYNKNIKIIENENSDLIIKINQNENKINELKKELSNIERNIRFIENENFRIFEIIFEINNNTNELPDLYKMIKNKELFELDKKDFDNMWFISKNNIAQKIKYYRYSHAINEMINGLYVNPFLALSFKKSQTINNIENFNSDDLSNYELNSKQKLAIQKSLMTNSVAYIQGPPGTGKTQTLSFLAKYLVQNKNQNFLITSSTHEAINNFFDRLYDDTSDDPNIFFLRYIYYKKNLEASKNIKNYDDESLFGNFNNRISNFIQNKSDNDLSKKIDKILDRINALKLKGHTNNLSNSLINYIENNLQNITESDLISLKQNINEFEIFSNLYELIKFVKKYFSNREVDNVEVSFLIDEVVKDFSQYNLNIIDLITLNNLEIFLNKVKNSSATKLDNIYIKIKNNYKYYENEKQKMNSFFSIFAEEEKHFKQNLINNNLINIIGITTASRKQIEIEGISKNLFGEYPIDYLVIDEVSKSITPDILSCSILAKKIILAGDYRQLPPNNDLSFESDIKPLWIFLLNNLVKNEKFSYIARQQNIDLENNLKIVEFIKNDDNISKYLDNPTKCNFFLIKEAFKDFNEKNYEIKVSNSLEKQNVEDENLIKHFYEFINKLYNTSLFKNQVKNIKKSNSLNSAYQYLDVQHRFTKEIMDIVNLTYDDDEKLQMPLKILKNFSQYKYEIDSKTYISSVNKIDTSLIEMFSKPFQLLLDKNKQIFAKILSNNSNSFDSKFDFILQREYPARINPWNAINSIYFLLNFLKLNQNVQANNIGVICMTRSQVQLTKKYINNINNIFDFDNAKEFLPYVYILKEIKIDTVDNFQGREKDIIILDLVAGKNKYSKQNHNITIMSGTRNVDFYEKPERLNVSVSRAKSLLILLGAFDDYLTKEVSTEIEKFNNTRSDFDSKKIKLISLWIDKIKERLE